MDIYKNRGYNAIQQETCQVSYHLNIMLLFICDSQEFTTISRRMYKEGRDVFGA